MKNAETVVELEGYVVNDIFRNANRRHHSSDWIFTFLLASPRGHILILQQSSLCVYRGI